MLDVAIAGLFKTALQQAVKSAGKWLGKAVAEVERSKKYNMVACIGFLEAARGAIRGLEDELDQILIDAKYTAAHYWTKKNRAELDKRIDVYLNREQVRPILDESLRGIARCGEQAREDIIGFFGRVDHRKGHAIDLLMQFHADMEMLGNSLGNYIGPSGLQVRELGRFRELLQDPTKAVPPAQGAIIAETEAGRRREISGLVDKVQREREHRGFAAVAKGKAIMHDLMVAFRLERQAMAGRKKRSRKK